MRTVFLNGTVTSGEPDHGAIAGATVLSAARAVLQHWFVTARDELGPVAMIFVPSVDGISHRDRERSETEHLVAGARVLPETLRRVHGLLAVGR